VKELSLNAIDRNVIDLSVSGRKAPGARRIAAARADLRAMPAGGVVCRWRRDPATGALVCVWSASRGGREPAPPVPLRRAG
jgi:hypothetical protein